MAFPVKPVLAGDVFTAHGFNLAQPVYAWKLASESVTSLTTEQADDDLFLPLEPLSTYTVLTVLGVTGPTAADFKLSYTVPTGATGRRHSIGLSTSTTSTTGNSRVSVHGWTNAVAFGTSTTALSIIEEGIISTDATSGVLAAQWAQNTSNATAVTVEAGSFMQIRQVIG